LPVKDVFENVARLLEKDKVPLAFLAAGDFIAWFNNYNNYEDYYFGGYRRKLEAQINVIRSYPEALILPGIWADFSNIVEGSAFGCEYSLMSLGSPIIKRRAVNNLEDIERLRIPDPKKDGLMPRALKELEAMVKEVPKDLKENYNYCNGIALSLGPFDIASQIVGYNELLLLSYKDKNLVFKLLDIAKETAKVWLEAQFEVQGGEWLSFIIEDSISLLSPKQFEELVLPYDNFLIYHFKRKNTLTLIHNCDRTEHLLKPMSKLNANIIHFSPEVKIKKIKENIKNSALMGGLNPFGKILKGSKEELLEEAKNLLSEAKDTHFILSVSGSLPVGMKKENLLALIKSFQ